MQPELAYELFGGEEEEFRRAVRAFVDKELAGHAEEWEEAEAFPREVIARAGELGFLGLKYPEKYGGAAEDGREAKGWLADAVFTEELAGCGSGGLAASVQAHKDLFCLYVYSYGSEEQRRRWLVPAVDGKLVGALAVDEPATGPEVGTIETRAARQADGWTLNGTKALVTNGAWCDAAVVVAKTEAAPGRAGLSLFVVDADTPGFSARKVRTLGCRTAQTAELSFRDCRVPDACLLGEVGRGHDYLEANSAWERLVVALEEVARVERTYRSAKEYASTREAFGRPIGKFQVWRHRFADIATAMEEAKRLNYHALRLFLAGEPCRGEVAMAKLRSSEVAFWVTDEALQVHGGYGYMMEYPVQRAWRDTRFGLIGGGTSEMMRDIVIGDLAAESPLA